ncbi:MAG: YhbY family RNA-binding protein [Lachnospiraceae bacterium]|nr:YhbY family RNA-binding protein [Lachnospiraceae bacterium]
MNSKQRAYLKGLAMNLSATFQIGKGRITPSFTEAIDEALEANELIKISVLNNSLEDPKSLAITLSERTGAEIVQVIGKKIVLYRPSKTKNRIKI